MFKSCHSTVVAKLITPGASAHTGRVSDAQGRALWSLLNSHSTSQASSTTVLLPSGLWLILHYWGKNDLNHHIQLFLPFLAQWYLLPSKLQGNSCRVLNKSYTSVPCRKFTQVLLNESTVCQHILFPILNVNSRSCFQRIREIEEIFLYLYIYIYAYIKYNPRLCSYITEVS